MKKHDLTDEYEFSIEDNKDWNEKLHISILIILGAGIILALIILFINRPDTMRSNIKSNVSEVVTENIIREDNQKTVSNGEATDIDFLLASINRLTVTDTVATTESSIEEVVDTQDVTTETVKEEVVTEDVAEVTTTKRNIALNINSSEVKDIVIINEVAGESLSLTRFQVVSTLYNLLLSEDKLPHIDGYQITYEDNKDIPPNYVSAICCADYIKLFNFEKVFDGYKYITKDETTKAIDKLQVYLDNYKKAEVKIDEPTAQDKEKRGLLETDAAELLKDRETSDKLYGQSVATYENPKTLMEIETNQSNVKKENILNIDNSDIYSTEKKLTVDYANIDEVLLDYSVLTSTLDKTITGVTFMEPLNLNISLNEGKMIINDTSIINSEERGPLSFYKQIVGIKDNKIVSTFKNSIGLEGSTLYTNNTTEIDSIGFVLMRQYFENSDAEANIEMDKQDYILVIAKLI